MVTHTMPVHKDSEPARRGNVMLNGGKHSPRRTTVSVDNAAANKVGASSMSVLLVGLFHRAAGWMLGSGTAGGERVFFSK